MAAIDIVFLVIICIFALHCCLKGFISEIMSLGAIILGILSAIFFFRKGGDFLRATILAEVSIIPEIIAFVAIFFIVFAVIKVLEIMLKNIIHGIHLGGVDRLLGLVFGLAEGVIVVCLLLFLISILPFVNGENILKESFFAQLLLPFVIGIKEETIYTLEGMSNGV